MLPTLCRDPFVEVRYIYGMMDIYIYVFLFLFLSCANEGQSGNASHHTVDKCTELTTMQAAEATGVPTRKNTHSKENSQGRTPYHSQEECKEKRLGAETPFKSAQKARVTPKRRNFLDRKSKKVRKVKN